MMGAKYLNAERVMKPTQVTQPQQKETHGNEIIRMTCSEFMVVQFVSTLCGMYFGHDSLPFLSQNDNQFKIPRKWQLVFGMV